MFNNTIYIMHEPKVSKKDRRSSLFIIW